MKLDIKDYDVLVTILKDTLADSRCEKREYEPTEQEILDALSAIDAIGIY